MKSPDIIFVFHHLNLNPTIDSGRIFLTKASSGVHPVKVTEVRVNAGGESLEKSGDDVDVQEYVKDGYSPSK